MSDDAFEIPPFEPGNPPRHIFFFGNGLVAVCDQRGQQMPRYQRANSHREAIELLAADGYDWREIPERHGAPQR